MIIFIMASRQVTTVSSFTLKVFFTAAIALLCLGLGATIPDLTIKWLFLLFIFVLFTAAAWFYLISANEKSRIRSCLK